jgi:hypothetical protein
MVGSSPLKKGAEVGMADSDQDLDQAEKLFAVAGRLLDKSTIDADARALEVARIIATLARTLTLKPRDADRYAAQQLLSVAERTFERVADLTPDQLKRRLDIS